MLKFLYININIIFILYAIFYIILLADLFLLPPKYKEEEVKSFNPNNKYYNVGSRNRFASGKIKSKLEYLIHTKSGMTYNFGTSFPEELTIQHTKFIGISTRLFSIQKNAITENYIYDIDKNYFCNIINNSYVVYVNWQLCLVSV